MPIPESQIETWSHQGSVAQSSETYSTIRNALRAANSSYSDQSFEVFLQGSYGNDTNIYADSDVDVVIRLDSIFQSNITDLSPAEWEAYNNLFPNATYKFVAFKNGVLESLESRFGSAAVAVGNKAIKIKAKGSRRSADVIVCYRYRFYRKFDTNHPDDCTFGIIIPTPHGDIINYPKQHSDNLTSQHQSTGQMLKPMVRILKNMRNWMVENAVLQKGIAPSYYLEGLFYNVPPAQYVATSFADTFCNGINWILEADHKKLVCANRRHYLLGQSSVQWNDANLDAFLDAVGELWKDW